MPAPTGDQYALQCADYSAVITQSATLRVLRHGERDLIDGFPVDRLPSGGRGQLLVPWPNRIEDGRYDVDGRTHQLALSEPARRNASHGLVRWACWQPVAHTAESVTLGLRLLAQTGYPWTLDLQVVYRLGPDGLEVELSARNRSDSPAPYACGAHPYLRIPGRRIDDLTLSVPARTRTLSDPERLLPIGEEPVEGTRYDLRTPRLLGDLALDDAFGDLYPSDDSDEPGGIVRVELRAPDGEGVALWADGRHRHLQLFTADGVPGHDRASIAVEPMTARANAFRTGEDVIMLAPEQQVTTRWGITALS